MLDEKTEAIHFGIVGVRLNDIQAHALSTLGFYCDGDSFTEWGESLDRHDTPEHVTIYVDNASAAEVARLHHVVSCLLVPGIQRVTDYAYVTDSANWSERARAWHRFDSFLCDAQPVSR